MLFNRLDEKSIENYGRKLEGTTLRKKGINELSKGTDKGGFNKIVEQYYFKIDNNNLQVADFSEAGVELKVAPLKEVNKNKDSNLLRKIKGLSMKERTVLTMIDYNKLSKETWETNSLKEKAFKILFCFYIWKKNISQLDFIFDLVSLWEPNKNDLEIIKQDWNTIVEKIKKGKAHEISEGDTLYLGACTKGANANSKRPQPYSEKLAKQRAFSFKRSYMDTVYEELLEKRAQLKENKLILIKNQDKTLEETIKEIFEPYIGKSIYDIERELHLECDETKGLAKHYYYLLSNKIFGIDTKNIEEFKKAGITLKTLRVKKDGKPLESISFPTFKFEEIIKEDVWEESQCYNYLIDNKFLYVIYEITTEKKSEYDKMDNLEKKRHLKLKKVKLWKADYLTLEEMEKVWRETKKVIKEGVKIIEKNGKSFNNLPDSKFNKVAHVRPHAKNKNDTYPLPGGGELTKQCFWFNAEYIKNEVVLENDKH